MHPFGGHPAAAGVLVGGQQLAQVPHAADHTGPAEPPGRCAQPAEVLGRVARMGELPVEDGTQAAGADEQVAHPEVAVDGDGAVRVGPVEGEPPHAELERRSGLPQAVQEGERVVERVTARQAGDAPDRDAVDGGQCGSALAGQRGPRPRPGLVVEQPARDGLALEALDDQPSRVEPAARARRHHPGHGYAGLRRGAEQGRLDPGPLTGRHPDAALLLEDERADGPVLPHEVERTGDAGRAAGQAGQAADGPAEDPTELRRWVGGWRRHYSRATTGLPSSPS